MVKWEEMSAVEPIYCEAIRYEFSRHHIDVMLVKRCMGDSVPLFVLKEVNQHRYCLKAVIVATRVFHVHGGQNWCDSQVLNSRQC